MLPTLRRRLAVTALSLALAAGLLAVAGCQAAAGARPLRSYRDVDYHGLRERYVKVDGVRVCYVDEGAGDDILVLLHPMASTLKVWGPTIAALRGRHRLVAIDLPGHGKSDKPAGFRYHPESFARVVRGVLDHLKLGQVTLVGNSNGGATSLALTLRHPERVRRLVLVDSGGVHPFSSLAHGFVHATFKARHLRTTVPWFLRLAVRVTMFVGRTPLTEEYVEDFIAQRQAREFDAWAAAQVHVVEGVMAYDVSRRLGSLRTPTLVVWGEQDQVLPVTIARRTAAAIPGARLVVVPRTGHIPELESPAAFVRALDDFIRATPAATPTASPPRVAPPPTRAPTAASTGA